jgi:hypothetical protein
LRIRQDPKWFLNEIWPDLQSFLIKFKLCYCFGLFWSAFSLMETQQWTTTCIELIEIWNFLYFPYSPQLFFYKFLNLSCWKFWIHSFIWGKWKWSKIWIRQIIEAGFHHTLFSMVKLWWNSNFKMILKNSVKFLWSKIARNFSLSLEKMLTKQKKK